MLDKFSSPSTCLILQPSTPTSRYLVVRGGADKPQLVLAGAFEHTDTESIVDRTREELARHSVSVNRAVLLMPRGELEVNSVRLPPATEEEMPELVANMAAQQAEDATSVNVSDFIVCQEIEDGSHDVLTFTMPQEKLDQWKQRFKKSGMKLSSVTFGGIGAVSLLNQVSNHPARTSIVVTTTDQDTDLAIVEAGKPIVFRTIPRATGGEQFVTDQLAGDIRRTLTMVGHPDEEEIRVYLIGTVGEQEDAAKSLAEKLSLSVSLVNPFERLSGAASVDKPSRFANLIGTACAWKDASLLVDLLNPRESPKQPGIWQRYGFWLSMAGALALFGGYILWEQAADKRIELEDQRAKLQTLIKPVKRSQSRQAVVAAVQSWRASEVSWLDELLWLSETFPPASDATVGTVTMTSNRGGGRIELPIVATDTNVRMNLEKAVRDDRHTIRSKRVIDASNPTNAAWRFNSTVTVAASPLASLDRDQEEPATDPPAVAESYVEPINE